MLHCVHPICMETKKVKDMWLRTCGMRVLSRTGRTSESR